jgi:hypothetical protein
MSIFPDHLKSSLVKPLYKKGDKASTGLESLIQHPNFWNTPKTGYAPRQINLKLVLINSRVTAFFFGTTYASVTS